MSVKTNIELVNKAKEIATKYDTIYVMGSFGSPMTMANKKRYSENGLNNLRKSKIAKATADTFAFDCSNLVKGILWGWNGDKSDTYGGAKYATNGVPDINADSMIKACKEVSTNFKDIEVGEALWCSGHIGIYIGDGKVVESTPDWKNKVQVTKLSQRKWTKHGKLKYIDYSKQMPAKKSVTQIAKEVLDGKWGNGEARKTALIKAGYDYKKVQAKVNELAAKPTAKPTAKSITELAKEVIAGKWGTGAERKAKLLKAGYDYAKVQAKVNELLK
jgi:hypothetical protein